ncbi:hypothetical protein PYW07_003598 [Mythimna separata]|uniref:Uncharacterized protein n=1 Tax=Mythimna separata TaxID=271217 RepID=A0AAD7YNT5_MYTSE|nr:hypothetical protein PYW07_003598 [Mythimna separata]
MDKIKQKQQPVPRVKPKAKSNKKTVEDKPTLIICKKKGEYHVEMQACPENSEVNTNQYDPLVYRISREGNEERIQQRLRKKQRLVEEAVKKAWVDPYHPEICEKTCLRAYREAIGLSNPNNPDCNCSVEEEEEDKCSCCVDEEDSSDCSSLDVEWEIHFSPPIASQN